MKLNQKKKHCSLCKKTMIKYGKNRTGKQRWRCNSCKKIELKTRKDISEKKLNVIIQEWLLGFQSLSEIAKKHKTTRQTLTRKFSEMEIKIKMEKLKDLPNKLVILVDAKHISKDELVLVIYEYISQQVIAWSLRKRENYESWFSLLTLVKERYEVKAIVSDGQKGLEKAIFDVFGNITHQRCVIHVIRFCLSRLTRSPQTEAGRALRKIILSLNKIETEKEVLSFQKQFHDWNEKYHNFLKEKSQSKETGRKWYTHRKLRSVRSHLKNSIPFLFHYVYDKDIPKTTNHLEGGINSPLSELLRRHRGIQKRFKRLLVSLYLLKRRK